MRSPSGRQFRSWRPSTTRADEPGRAPSAGLWSVAAVAIVSSLLTGWLWAPQGRQPAGTATDNSQGFFSLNMNWGSKPPVVEPPRLAETAPIRSITAQPVVAPQTAGSIVTVPPAPTILLAHAELPVAEPKAVQPVVSWDAEGRVKLPRSSRRTVVEPPPATPAPERQPALEVTRLPPPAYEVAQLDDRYLRGPLAVDCYGGSLTLKPLNAISNKIAPEPGYYPTECLLIGGGTLPPRGWDCTAWNWKASNLGHLPLYFEQVQLERYGHALPPPLHPLYSAAHFFVSAAFLPYKMGIDPPLECIYTLGYYRPGSHAPYHVPGIPMSIRGALLEAAAVGGFAGVLLAQ